MTAFGVRPHGVFQLLRNNYFGDVVSETAVNEKIWFAFFALIFEKTAA